MSNQQQTVIAGSCRPTLRSWVRPRRDAASGKIALVFPEGMLELNETGTEIIDLCDGARSLDEIVGLLATRFEAPADLLRTDITDYLLRLRTKGLLELVETPGAAQ